MASLPVQMADGSENIIYKQYPVTGGGTGDHFFVFRVGNLRVIRAQMPAASSGTVFLTLDAIDRPDRAFYLPCIDFASYRAYCLKITTDGKVTQAGSSNVGGSTNSTYANGVFTTSTTQAT